jgi:hypothetical protein
MEVIKTKDKLIAKQKKDLIFLRGGEGGSDPNTPQMPQTNQDLVKMLEGKVLRVNKKWGFVMIDLGKDNKMIIGNKKKVEKSVALPEGKVMTVARNDKYIGQIKVVKVNNDCSIADMLEMSGENAIQAGDKVYFARKLAAPKKADDDSEDDSEDDATDDTADDTADDTEKSGDSEDSSDEDSMDE